MDANLINEIEGVLTKGTDKSLELRFSDNKLVLKKTNQNLEYVWWLLLIIGIPFYYLWKNPTIQVFIIAAFLSLAFVYTIYDSLLATNQLIIDLSNREVIITPNDKILRYLGLVKEKRIGFQEIEDISLGQKSNGRGQPPGRRLFIETIKGKIFLAIDFRNTSSAESFYRLLNNILAH